MLAILDKLTCIYKRTCKKLYKIWKRKSHSLKKENENLSVLVVTAYAEKFKGFKNWYKIIFETF